VRATQTGDGLLGVAHTSTPIFVLRRNHDIFQHGTLAVARTAGRLGIPVYGVYENRLEPAGLSRYNRGRLSVSQVGQDDRLMEALTAVGKRLGPTVLIPVDDASAVFVGDNADALRGRFLFPEQPTDVYRRLSSKREMHDLCLELGIPTPASSFPQDEAQLRELAGDAGLPVVLKQIDGWLPSTDPSAPSVLIAGSPQELIEGYRRMESPEGPNVMLQEYIPGGSDTIWIFNGYFDGSSQCLVGFTGRKLRQRGPHTGPATLGECVTNEVVAEATHRLAGAVGYRGLIDIGFRYDRRDGQYKLLDVNPRLGSSFRLFVGDNGMDVVRALYLDMTGQAVPPSSTRNGRKWIVEPYDMVSALQLGREGSLRFSDWLRSFRGVREAAWLTRDDPLPFLAMALGMIPAGLPRLRAAPVGLKGRRNAHATGERLQESDSAEPVR
jgi:D-aspartate ligase